MITFKLGDLVQFKRKAPKLFWMSNPPQTIEEFLNGWKGLGGTFIEIEDKPSLTIIKFQSVCFNPKHPVPYIRDFLTKHFMQVLVFPKKGDPFPQLIWVNAENMCPYTSLTYEEELKTQLSNKHK